jgi:hypothetical protein
LAERSQYSIIYFTQTGKERDKSEGFIVGDKNGTFRGETTVGITVCVREVKTLTGCQHQKKKI